MIDWIAEQLEPYFRTSAERIARLLRLTVVAVAAVLFVLITTAMVSYDALFTQATFETLEVGSIAPQDFVAPQRAEYVSAVLTEERRSDARDAVEPVYTFQDAGVARQQITLAQNILDFIDDIRRDPYASAQQKINDLSHIRNLQLPEEVLQHIVMLDDETWSQLEVEIIAVLERVMRGQIRDNGVDLPTVIGRMPGQIVSFEGLDAETVIAIVSGLLRANSFFDEVATQQQRESAAANVPDARIVFERGQLIVSAREPINALAYEALTRFGLLGQPESRWREVARALMVSIVVLVIFGLYMARFRRDLLYKNPRLLTLLALVFVIMIVGARAMGLEQQVYLYPAAALALLFVAVVGPEAAILATLALALLVGFMDDSSLEVTAYITAGGLFGVLTLRTPERLDNYFFAGLMVGLVNILVVVIFNLETLAIGQGGDLTLLLLALANGVLSSAVAVAGLYAVTVIFNLPTSLRLLALSQPNQPLLQRLLREAPGTYTHSLQVANLSEQAANAIGANAPLVHVAALYHDIGKMLNPVFFVENQANALNPHDALNDPYRSADIIISHVEEGDKMARQYRLPNRLRDFIREHHGTTQVTYFYRKAVAEAGEESVDPAEFTYPGPKPQTRETAIVMISDSCESATRARKPATREEVREIVHQIIDEKIRTGQLDESGLTLNDIKVIQRILVDMLQAVFHPRINYPAMPSAALAAASVGEMALTSVNPSSANATGKEHEKGASTEAARKTGNTSLAPTPAHKTTENYTSPRTPKSGEVPVVRVLEDDEAPLPDVPPLPRMTGEMKALKLDVNGTVSANSSTTNKADAEDESQPERGDAGSDQQTNSTQTPKEA